MTSNRFKTCARRKFIRRTLGNSRTGWRRTNLQKEPRFRQFQESQQQEPWRFPGFCFTVTVPVTFYLSRSLFYCLNWSNQVLVMNFYLWESQPWHRRKKGQQDTSYTHSQLIGIFLYRHLWLPNTHTFPCSPRCFHFTTAQILYEQWQACSLHNGKLSKVTHSCCNQGQ